MNTSQTVSNTSALGAPPSKALQQLRQSSLFRLLAPFKRELWVLVGISSVANLLMLLPMIYMLQIFDRIMISKSLYSLLFVSLIVAAMYALQAYSEWLRTRLIVAAGVRIDMAINAPLFQSVFEDKLGEGKANPIQALNDLTAIRQWMTGNGLHAFLDAPWAPFYLALMFLLHPVLGWLTVAFMIILLAFAFFALRKTMQVNDASLEDEKELNDFIHNKLRNAEVIEAQGMVPNLQRQWWKRQVELAKLQHESLDLEERVTSTSKQLKFAMNSLGLGVGALLAMQGELTMGAMIAASMLMSRATAPIDNLVFGWKGLLTARMAFERIEALLTQYAGKASDLPKRTAKGFGFELQNVYAHVGSSPQPVLKGLSLSIPQGSCTVVLGASGAGKSTLARLLVGISQPSQGSVLMGGVNLNELDRNALAPDLGYLPQEVELFADTMANNMARLGEPDSNKVIAAAKAVGIHEFILSLPKGYDTIIGEVGGVLSGGQRQRIALARAVYGFPRLLVLDEPNASLDETGETALSALIQGLKAQGVTIVLISHRPAVVQQADNVLVLENGQTQFWGPLAAYTGRGQASSPSSLA